MLTACADLLTARGRAPVYQASFKAPLERAAACLVDEFNKLNARITHKVVVIKPQAILEVAPQQEITLTAEVAFARLEAGAGGTAVALYATFQPARYSAAVAACARIFQ